MFGGDKNRIKSCKDDLEDDGLYEEGEHEDADDCDESRQKRLNLDY